MFILPTNLKKRSQETMSVLINVLTIRSASNKQRRDMNHPAGIRPPTDLASGHRPTPWHSTGAASPGHRLGLASLCDCHPRPVNGYVNLSNCDQSNTVAPALLSLRAVRDCWLTRATLLFGGQPPQTHCLVIAA